MGTLWLESVFIAAFVLSAFLATRLFLANRRLRKRFSPIVDVDAEVAKAKAEVAGAVKELEQHRARVVSELDALVAKITQENESRRAAVNVDVANALENLRVLRESYATAKATFDRLAREVSLLEENVNDISVGLYKPHFNFASSDDYKAKLASVNEAQKRMVREEAAVNYAHTWSINGSAKEGQRMQKQYGKLLLRAFNGECDACIARVSWDNATRMEERIAKAFETLNGLGGVMQIALAAGYRDLKLQELHLEFELENKKHEELEEQREIRERMREEEKAQKELDRARKEAEDDEARYQRALDKARTEVARARGDEVGALLEKVNKIEADLLEAKRQKERAISRAQQTRSGYVYVISNVGSFGETVFKIGMTRRLDPMDRVRELGDASVPFGFDVHAMFYTEDAPTLENALHKHFSANRMNLVNGRKEFFHLTFEELEAYAKLKSHKIEFTRIAEAREYRESAALRLAKAAATLQVVVPAPTAEAFPQAI